MHSEARKELAAEKAAQEKAEIEKAKEVEEQHRLNEIMEALDRAERRDS